MARSAAAPSTTLTSPLARWLVALAVTVASGVAIVTAATPADASLYENHGNCVEGTFVVRHGVTAVHVTAVGAAGEDGQDVTENRAGGTVDWQGGAGGLGSKVETTIPVTYGMTLYVGVANSAMPGGDRPGDNTGGKGGAASWVTTVDPRVNGACKPAAPSLMVVAAGGGGGGGAGNRSTGHPGGAGGSESSGGKGGDESALWGSSGDAGKGGAYSDGTSAGGGGLGGSVAGCVSGQAGAAGTLMAGGRGGEAGVPRLNQVDCTTAPPGCDACDYLNDAYGGGGGGGGGGLYGGGGGGGGTSSGWGAGGGGASGRSYARNPISYGVTPTHSDPLVIVEAVTAAPVLTSGSAATFTRGTFGTTPGTATGVETPFVRFLGTMPNGVTNSSGQFSDDGGGTGSATLSGTPSQDGVYPLTVEACNSVGCDSKPFTLTVNGSPGFTTGDKDIFVAGSAGTHTIRTSGYPAAAITQSGAPAWLTLTDQGNGTATLTGTPPAGAASQYVVNLTAANGIGSNATQALTIKVVTALSVTPPAVHLAPGNSSPGFQQYSRVFTQQLRAVGTFADGSTGDVTDYVRWDSSAPNVASVSGGALVTANALGNATVTARTAGAVTATSSIVVAMPLSITMSPVAVSLMGGQTQQFTATGCYASPCAANSFDISHHVMWSVSNFDAHVDADGLATAHAGGTTSAVFADVVAGLSGLPTVRGEADITITHGDVVEVDVTPDDLTVPTRTVVRYHGMLRYQDGTLAHDSPYVTWSVSGIGTATIGAGAGDAYSPDPGTLTVRGTFTNVGGGTVHGDATLHVIRTPSQLVVQPLTGSAFTPLVKGGIRQYQALARYSDGAPDVDVTNGVTWTSGDPSSLLVSSGGLVTAKTATESHDVPVFADYQYENVAGGTSTISGSSTVTMTLLPPLSIAITPMTPSVLHPNQSLQFTATGTYADGSTANLTTRVNWSSSNAGIGTVSTSGDLHVQAGTTTGNVTVSAWVLANGGVLDSNGVVVTVTDPLDHVSLRTLNPGGNPAQLVAGTSTLYPYRVEGFDSQNNSLGDVTAGSTITMSPDGSCDPVLLTCTATVADLGLNRHTIQATDNDAVHPASNAITIQVVRATTQRVEITGGSTSIIAGESTAPYHVTGYDAYDNAFDATNQTQFSVLPVETTSGCNGSPGNTPTCHAVTEGAHTVRASVLSGAFVQNLPLWVHPSPVLDHMTLSGGSASVPVGTSTAPYVVTGFDPYGNSSVITNQTELLITPDGTCDEAFTCRPASPGAHSVTARRIAGTAMTSNAKALNAVAPPTIDVSFTPDTINKQGFSTLRFTLTNPNPSTDLHGIAFSATVPASLVANQFINGCNRPGFQFNTPPGGFTMSGVTLVQGESCTFQYIGIATAAGSFTSTMSNVTSTEGGGSAATDTATLTVNGPPLLTKRFAAGSVPIGSTTPLTFTVTNPNTALALTGIGFYDTLPAGLSFASTTVTGSCGSAVISIQGNTLYVGPDGATGPIGGSVNTATLAAGQSCTFSANVHADSLGSKNNATSNVTSTERGTGPQGLATVVVTPQVDHFDIQMVTLTAGVPGQLTVTAYDRFNNVITGYAGIPTLTGDFSDSATGCGPAGTDPCPPEYALPQFVNGVGTATVTAYKEEFSRQVTVTDGTIVSPSSQGLSVDPGPNDHITLEGGSASIAAGDFTGSYFTHRWDKYGNPRAGSSFTIGIAPDGLCNGVDICGAHVADADGSHHTVTATDVSALHPTATRSLVVGHGPVSRITVDGGDRTRVAGQTTQPYTVYGWDLFDNPIADLPVSDVTLDISPNGTCDSVVRTCRATVADPPGWWHSVRATHVNGPFADGDDLVVSAGPLDHLTLAPATATVAAQQFQPYVAVGYDAYGNSLGDKTAQTTFTVDDGECVGESCHSGTAGDRTVTGTLGSVTGTATLTVQAGQLFHITLTGGSPSVVAGTDTAPYVVQGFDADGNPLGDVTSGATLSITEGSCDNVAHTCTANVPDNGGNHVVTATHPGAVGGPTAQADLVVTAAPVPIDHIVLTGGSPSIVAGTGTAPYVVTAYDSANHSLGVVTNSVTLDIDPDGSCDDALHTCTASVTDTGGGHHTVAATHTATGLTDTVDVVVTASGGGGGGGVLDHFGFATHDMTVGQWEYVAVTAYDANGDPVTGYAGTPQITSTIGSSAKGCGPVGLDPCPPQQFVSPFTNGMAKVQILAFKANTGRTLTLTDGVVVSTSDPFTIAAGDLDHAALSGGSASLDVGDSTAPYVVTGYDFLGNPTGDLTGVSTFSILPSYGSSCTGNVCTSTSAGPHTVLADVPNLGTLQSDVTFVAGPAAALFVFGDFEVEAGVPTAPYQVYSSDAYGNTVADVTDLATLAIGPDGTCEQVTHTCRATHADTNLTIHEVTATVPGIVPQGSTGLSVLPGPHHHVALSPDGATVNAGQGKTFTATSQDVYGNDIADVTPDTTFGIDHGSCTGAACASTLAGDRTVTGTYGGKAAVATLHVVAGALDHITLTGGSTTVDAGTATAPYQVLGFDAYGNARGDVTGASTLSISPDGTCSQVAHTCTPASGGAHTVTATDTAAVHPTATKALSVNAVAGADVRLTKTGPATVVPGANAVYNLSARNFGPSTATGVTVSDPFPAGTTYVAETHPSGWTCTTSGTYLCTRASLTVAAGAQAFTLTLRVAPTATGVSNTATISAANDTTPGNNTPAAVVSTVSCAAGRTITGLYAGDLTLSGAGTTCIRNATVTGKLTVQKGASLVMIGSVVGKAVAASGSGALTFCGSSLRSSVSIDAATGFVLVGDPGDDNCAGNTITGNLGITGGLAGLNLRSNSLLSSVTVDKNKGGGPYPVDASPVIAANTIGGRLACKSNTPAPVNAGQPNTAPTKSGQCATL